VFGLRGFVLNWFHPYLSEKIQYGSIHQAISDAVSLIFGVPQGSFLGILLFVLCTFSLTTAAWHYGICIHVESSDMQLYTTVDIRNETSRVESMAKIEYMQIGSWRSSNLLKLNDNKMLILASSLLCILIMYQYHQVSLSGALWLCSIKH